MEEYLAIVACYLYDCEALPVCRVGLKGERFQHRHEGSRYFQLTLVIADNYGECTPMQ